MKSNWHAFGGKSVLFVALAAAPLVTGCGDFWQAPSGSTSSTVTLTASPTTAIVGASVVLTAAVTPTAATGTVTFYNGSTSLGTGTLASGTATLTTTFSTAGTLSLTVKYGGDTTYSGSTSTALSFVVTAAGTTASHTVLSASSSNPAVGANLTLTATVTPPAATGTIIFLDGSTQLATETLVGGTVSYSTTSLATGPHSLTASYSGDGTYAASVSSAVSVTVGAASSSSDCGYQDSTNNSLANALDAYTTGTTTLTSPGLTVGNTDESAVCAQATGTAVTITGPTIVSTSTGSNQNDSAIYGTSAAVLAYGSSAATASGATIGITGGGTIITTGEFSSGAFASGDGAAITLSGTSVTTSNANAFGLAASEGGALNLTNVTAKTLGLGSSALMTNQGGGTVTDSGGNYSAANGEALVVASPSTVNLTGTTLVGNQGAYRGILFYQSTAGASTSNTSTLTMTNGSLTYTCPVTASSTTCSSGLVASGQSAPATVFAVANTTATISLTDVAVTNDTGTTIDSQGTLLTAEALNSGTWGTAGSNGGNVTFNAQGETLTGDVIVDAYSTVALSLLKDNAGTGSTLAGAINNSGKGKTVDLTLDAASSWTVTGDSTLTNLTGLAMNGSTISNIDGGGFCVYYSGTINGATGTSQYTLGGTGGILAPAGTTGLPCL